MTCCDGGSRAGLGSTRYGTNKIAYGGLLEQPSSVGASESFSSPSRP